MAKPTQAGPAEGRLMDSATVVRQVAVSLFARRKKWVALTTLTALVLLVPTAHRLSKEPPRYRTAATVLIENKAGKEPLFQEFSPNRPLSVQLAILQSRVLAASVVEALPKNTLEDLLHNPYGRDYIADVTHWIDRLRGNEPASPTPQSRAVGELRRDRVKFINQAGPSGIVEIQAEATEPQFALDIANTYIEVLLARTRSFNVDDAKSTREYLAQQTVQISDALAKSEAAMRAFTTSRGGIQIPMKSTETAQRLSQLETTLAEVQANRNISQARLATLRAKAEAAPHPSPKTVVSAPAPAPMPVVSAANAPKLRAKLSSLEAQMVEAKSRYSEDHPRVRSLAQQIGEVQRELGDAVKEVAISMPGVGGAVAADERDAFADMLASLETSVVS